VVLKPDGSAEVTPINTDIKPGQSDEGLVARAVASYQCAYDLFTGRQMKESAVMAQEPKD